MVTPSDEAVNFISTSVLDNTGRHSFSVSGITTSTADIVLFPAESVSVDENGVVSFTANTRVPDNTGVSIELVNGTSNENAATGAGDTHVNDATVTDGAITFAIDSVVQDEVVAIVFDDADDDDSIDFTTAPSASAPQAPSEDFGVGGVKNWVPAEAANGAFTNQTVTSVNRNLDYFVAGGNTYFYDSNDIFRIQGGANLSQAQFEALLTAGDILDGTYDQDEADSSVFEVDTDVVPAPATITTTVSDADGDGTSDDVVVSWSASAQPDALYDLFRSTDNTCNASDTVLLNDSSALTFTDNSVASTSTSFWYCVRAVGGETGEESGFTTSTETVAPPVADTAAPFTVNNGALADTDAGTADLADAGDVWRLFFNEDVTLTNPSVRVDDGDSVRIVEHGVNATFVEDGNQVVITLSGTLTGVNYSDVIVVDLASGIEDASGNDWVPTALVNFDVTLEKGPAEVFADTADAGETTFDVAFNEPVIEASAENPANYTYSLGNVTSATLAADGRTVTLVVDTAAAEGATLGHTVVDNDGEIGTQTGYDLVDTTAPVMASATEAGGVVTITFSEEVNFIGAATDFWIVADAGTCGDAHLFDGTGVADDDLDNILEVTMDGDPTNAVDYELCIAADTVEDLSLNNNVAHTIALAGGA